jgi:hypothetical protein
VIGDQTLVSVRPVTLTGLSGRPEASVDRGPTALFVRAPYLNMVNQLRLFLLAIFIENTP